jgi:AraC family transcriptional regulator
MGPKIAASAQNLRQLTRGSYVSVLPEDVRAMDILRIEKDDLEPIALERQEQDLGMLLKPGAFDLGYKSSTVSRYVYGTGDMFLFPRCKPLLTRGIGADFILVSVSDAALMAVAGQNSIVEMKCKVHLEDGRIHGLMTAINAERLEGFPCGRLFLDSIELAIASALAGGHIANRRRPKTNSLGLTPFRLRRVVDFMEGNLQHDLSLQELADAAGLSLSHFSHMFRNSTGTSPHKFLLRRRVQRATELLRRPESRVRDVASACGFKTQQHFARAFRSVFGVSPKEYQHLEP